MTDIATLPDVLERHLRAYEAGDVDAFVDTFGQNAVVESYATGETHAEGRSAIRSLYAELFRERPELGVEVGAVVEVGNHVILEESIDVGGGDSRRAAGIYELRDGRIVSLGLIQ